jgi:Lon-like protease
MGFTLLAARPRTLGFHLGWSTLLCARGEQRTTRLPNRRISVPSYRDHDVEPPRPGLTRGWALWGLLLIVSIVVAGLGLVPSDYVIERPGPVRDVLGTVEQDGNPVSIIDIPSQQTYPTTGSLDMLTVSTVGNRESRPSWLLVAQAWIDPTQEIIPIDVAFPNGQTTEQSAEQSAAMMTQSQDFAVAAALTSLGYEYSISVSVAAVTAEGPSVDLLAEGDVITAVNGTPVTDAATLRSLIAESGVDAPLTVRVTRAGAAVDVAITPVLSTGDDPQPVIGIEVAAKFVFPFDVAIQQGDIGGPSAGQIFALAIIDKLTPGSLNGGLAVAGTGTITPDGVVGAIGGITQKLYGAQRAGARYFLAPASNCADIAAGSVPDNLDIYAVSTLADSLYVLNTLSTGASTALLPRCPAN